MPGNPKWSAVKATTYKRYETKKAGKPSGRKKKK